MRLVALVRRGAITLDRQMVTENRVKGSTPMLGKNSNLKKLHRGNRQKAKPHIVLPIPTIQSRFLNRYRIFPSRPQGKSQFRHAQNIRYSRNILLQKEMKSPRIHRKQTGGLGKMELRPVSRLRTEHTSKMLERFSNFQKGRLMPCYRYTILSMMISFQLWMV